MKQGVLPFQYEEEKSSTGMTALSGLPAYLELAHAAGLRSSLERHVGLRRCGQGWTDIQVLTSLIMLNLAGGESVDIPRWLMPDCQRRTTSAISTLDTSLYAIAAPYIQSAAMVTNPAHRVVNHLAKWSIVPGV